MLREFEDRDPPGSQSSTAKEYVIGGVAILAMLGLLISGYNAVFG